VATPATSIDWAVLFREQSVSNMTTYSATYDAVDVTEAQVKDLVRRLEKLGYIEVTYALRVVLP
jgi:DNA-binding Lrp family transcriptional regulator